MALTVGQPRIRYAEYYNPASIEGISFLPKIITIEKTIADTGVTNLVALPAECFIRRVDAVVKTACTATNGTIDIGFDGDTDGLIDNTVLALTTANAHASFATGEYLASGDILACEVTTAVDGVVRIVVEYLELAEMFKSGNVHIDV